MLITTDIRNIAKIEADSKFAIVRSLRSPIVGVKQWADLSPSRELFYEYLRLRDAGKWNADAFENIYVPKFIAEMRAPRAQSALAKLHDMAVKTDVAVACFCDNERLCHRSIIASLLAATGVNVKTKIAPNPAYAAMYQRLA